jgi:K(+)-stimulated pyrophosphate-energized sodium pump
MISRFPTVLLLAAIWASYALAGFYGVALAASAMMATTAITVGNVFGPISDNRWNCRNERSITKEYVPEPVFWIQ